MSIRRRALPSVVLLALAAAACAPPADDTAEPTTSSPTDASTSSAPSGTPAEPSDPPPPEPTGPAGPAIEITVAGDQVSPNAEEIALDVGEPLLVRVTADRAVELHVHAKPEQYLEFEAGTSEQELVIETPGTVEVEEHDSGAVVALLEVG